ncbi:MAG: hypothetical protein AAF797_10460 [Planctomycetota bacterium]
MQERWRELVIAVGAGVMVVMLAVPALVPLLPVGVWDQDPRVVAAMSGADGLSGGLAFGPGVSVWWFAGTVVVAGLVWGGCVWAGHERLCWTGWLAVGGVLVGMVGVGWWMSRGYEHLFIGAGWLAGGAAGLAGWRLGRSACGRRWAAAGLAGLAVWMGLEAVYEVVVEAGRNAAFWEAEGAKILEARGLEPGSAGAELLERRTLSLGAVGGVRVGERAGHCGGGVGRGVRGVGGGVVGGAA